MRDPGGDRRRDGLVETLAGRLLDPWPLQQGHWDIHNDNLIRRPDGSVVFVDWGACAVAPGRVDPLLARLARVDTPWFDDSVASSAALAAAGDDVVTGFLLGLGCHLARRSTQGVADVGLPTHNEFRRTEGLRLLEAAARRLG